MWSEALVSAVIISKSQLPSSTSVYRLTSEQIIDGYTPSNQAIIPEHKHSQILASSSNNFEVDLQFTLLADDTDYIAYITA